MDGGPEKKRRIDDQGLQQGQADIAESLAKLRAAAKAAVDSIALSLLGPANGLAAPAAIERKSEPVALEVATSSEVPDRPASATAVTALEVDMQFAAENRSTESSSLGLQSQLLQMQQEQSQANAFALSLELPSFSSASLAPPAEGEGGQLAAQMYMLAQLAEESAQTANSAAACVLSPESDPAQVTTLAQAAQQAAQRATWAATTLISCFPAPLGPPANEQEEWMISLRQITQQAAEAAEAAAATCGLQVAELANKLGGLLGDKKSKVPCKWFLLGQCKKAICEFSHNIDDLQPRPLHKKRAEQCHYFQKGQCTRGTACPFAHGADELAEISRIVTDLKTEKRMFPRAS